MRIEHVALYVRDLDRSRDWYARWFGATANARYDSVNQPGLSTYFLTFPGDGARVELMTHPALGDAIPSERRIGLSHLAIAFPDRAAVDTCVATMIVDGVDVHRAARVTGDGYYEAVVRDPDGNLIELVARGPATGYVI